MMMDFVIGLAMAVVVAVPILLLLDRKVDRTKKTVTKKGAGFRSSDDEPSAAEGWALGYPVGPIGFMLEDANKND